jgi:hypothetical protein
MLKNLSEKCLFIILWVSLEFSQELCKSGFEFVS